jgi:LuxR family maltose regulon positive regulatory protein
MAVPLLTTKLFIPPAAKSLVSRPHLQARLDECLHPGCRLALVSAPAGFGKTTLISTWVAFLATANRQPATLTAWLSLDAEDNDPVTFWTYLVSALQTQAAGVGKDTLLLLQQPTPANPDGLLPALVNDLAQIPNPFILILDDLHLVRNPAIYQWLSYLIEHAPAQFHILAASRADPPLPLALLRGRGQLLEIRLAELRFSNQEADFYLNQAMRLALSSAAVDRLNAKTEGWAAGLQMAAIALQNLSPERQNNPAQFIETFSSSHRYILEYLLEEVLNRQPPEIVDFLLKTSVLTQMCASLCEAVIGDQLSVNGEESSHQPDHAPALLVRSLLTAHSLQTDHCQQVLETLDHSNLFLITLDQECRWYRYHHLFADLLQKRLNQVHPGLAEGLYARASLWCERNGLENQAVDYAFLSKNDTRAACLVDRAAETLWRQGAHMHLLSYLNRLPEEQFRAYPQLGIYQAALLASNGDLQQAEACLQSIESYPKSKSASAVASASATDSATAVAESAASLDGKIQAIRTLIAVTRGNIDDTVRFAQLALAHLTTEQDSAWQAYLSVILSNVHLVRGNLEAAIQNLKDAIQAGKQGGSPFIMLDATTKLAMELWVRGDLRQARLYCLEGLAYIDQHDLGRTQSAALLMLGYAFLLCEWNELDQAEAYLAKAMQLCRPGSNKTAQAWAYHLQIICLVARGDLPAAEAVAIEANQKNREGEIPVWLVTGINGLLGGVYLRQGKIAEAEQVLQSRHISVEDELRHPHQSEYFLLARLLMIKGDVGQAMTLLDRMLAWTTATKQTGWQISILIGKAQGYLALKEHQRAVEAIDRALELGEPEGYIQLFLGQSQDVKPLLEEAARRGGGVQPPISAPERRGAHRDYALRLLAAYRGSPGEDAGGRQARNLREEQKTNPPLSEREIEVIQLIAEGLSNKEIAQKLFISVRTVKYYTTSIFTKLEVDGRAHAAIRAKELGVIK